MKKANPKKKSCEVDFDEASRIRSIAFFAFPTEPKIMNDKYNPSPYYSAMKDMRMRYPVFQERLDSGISFSNSIQEFLEVYRFYHYSKCARYTDGVQQGPDFEGLEECLAFLQLHAPDVVVISYHKFGITLFCPQGRETEGLREFEDWAFDRCNPTQEDKQRWFSAHCGSSALIK